MSPLSAHAQESDPGSAPRTPVTLLDLVRELGEAGGTDREVAAAVAHLLGSGRVRLLAQDPVL